MANINTTEKGCFAQEKRGLTEWGSSKKELRKSGREIRLFLVYSFPPITEQKGLQKSAHFTKIKIK